MSLMIAMLEKRAGLQLLGDDVFVNIAGGLEVDEPAVDLGLVTAIASGFIAGRAGQFAERGAGAGTAWAYGQYAEPWTKPESGSE